MNLPVIAYTVSREASSFRIRMNRLYSRVSLYFPSWTTGLGMVKRGLKWRHQIRVSQCYGEYTARAAFGEK
jgi:hypothetical protein